MEERKGGGDPASIAQMRRLGALYKTKRDAGLEGCEREWADGGPCSDYGIPLGQWCAGCEAWAAFTV